MIQNLIEEIYDNYMNLDVRKVNDYLTELQEKTNMSADFIEVNLIVYSLKLGKDEYKKFNFRKNSIKKLNTKYVQKTFEILDLYKENRIHELKKYSSLSSMIKKTIEVYPEYNEELNNLLDYISNTIYKNTYTKKEVELFPNDDMYNREAKYVGELKNILINAKTDGEAIEIIRHYHYDDNEMEQLINKFSNRFANANDYIPRLIKLFDEYKKMKYNVEKVNVFNNEYEIKQAIELLYQLLNTDSSIYEYCHINKDINVSDIKKAISVLEYKKQNIIIEILNNRKNPKFEELIENIKNKIINNEIDIIDYYCLTRLSIFDFVNILKSQKDINIIKIRDFFNNSVRKGDLIVEPINIAINKNVELNNQRVINGYEFTRSEKIIIFEFIKDNEITLNEQNYIMCLNKYLNGTLKYNKLERIKKIIDVAEYIVNNEATIEKTAQKFGYSISSIKKYINDPNGLQKYDMDLYNKVKEVQQTIIKNGCVLGGKTGIRGPIHTDYEAEEIELQMQEYNLTYEQASKRFDIPESTIYEMVKRKQNRYKSFN